VRRSLIDPDNTIWQNAFGCLATPFILPIAIVVAPIAALFSRLLERTPEEVASYLRDFIEETGGDWDWDDFTSIPIADPRLDPIRKKAEKHGDPGEGLAELKALLAEAESLTGPQVE
jgi:hypothetical protein